MLHKYFTEFPVIELGFPQHANGSPPGCPTNSPATQPQENKHRNSWDPPCRVTPTRGWGISPRGNRLPAECVPSTTRSPSVRPGEAQGKSAPHRHFAKAMPHENSVLGIQGPESLSTSTFWSGRGGLKSAVSSAGLRVAGRAGPGRDDHTFCTHAGQRARASREPK